MIGIKNNNQEQQSKKAIKDSDQRQ